MLANQIRQIINLKRKHGLLEEDFTMAKAKEWYEFAIPAGFVELIYEKDELVGFAEWTADENNIVLVGNLIAERPYIMWKLKDRILAKNKNRVAVIWHRKRDNRMAVIRRKYEI